MVTRPRKQASGSASRPRRSVPRSSRKPRGTDAETTCAVLARELDEARQQQAATSEILRVIASSAAEVQPVFDTIVRSAVRLCDGIFGALGTFDGELVHAAALYNYTAEALATALRLYPMRPSRRQLTMTPPAAASTSCRIPRRYGDRRRCGAARQCGEATPLPARRARCGAARRCGEARRSGAVPSTTASRPCGGARPCGAATAIPAARQPRCWSRGKISAESRGSSGMRLSPHPGACPFAPPET